jgi:dTDP-4-dehydrorhamnose reductase
MSIRIAVTGRHGQVARALTEAGPQLGVEIVPLGRPELNLAAPETIGRALTAVAPNIVVNAAAYCGGSSGAGAGNSECDQRKWGWGGGG